MKYIFNVQRNGETVNIDSLPPEEQQQIKEQLSQKMADTISTQMARTE